MPAHRLNSAFIQSVKHSGRTRGAERHGDGGGLGLMLNVQPGGTKSWVQQITIRGKRRALGLGSYPAVGLAQARKVAFENRTVAREGGDPRKPKRQPPRFRDAALEIIDLLESGWACRKTRAHWESSLAAYAYPTIGDLRVDRITPADVIDVLRPIWATKRETASRVRQRISAVMRWAVANGHRLDDPAGTAVLQALPKGRPPVKHHRALHYSEVAEAIATVRATSAWEGTKLAFEFLVLTAARSGEVRAATWDEMDIDRATWAVPSLRMKSRKEHRVPLSDRALAVLAEARRITSRPLQRHLHDLPMVFPSLRGKIMSDMTLSKLLRQNGVDAVPHGFRSSFRDWAAETTDAPYAVMEAALAHTVASSTVRAYARSDLFDRRRRLMEEWATFLTGAKP